jgi:hypothetical protein
MLHTGNVRIGDQTTPTDALEVAGDCHITGKLTVDGAIDPTQVSITNGFSTPPLVIQNAVNVPNLDCDLLDGKHAKGFSQKASLGGIDGKTTGVTTLFTTPNDGTRFYPHAIIVEATAATGVIAVASISVGSNGASYNNILPITALTGVSAANVVLVLPVTTGVSIPANTDIKVSVTTGATGTTLTLKIIPIGVYD